MKSFRVSADAILDKAAPLGLRAGVVSSLLRLQLEWKVALQGEVPHQVKRFLENEGISFDVEEDSATCALRWSGDSFKLEGVELADSTPSSWAAVEKLLLLPARIASIKRDTSETTIAIEINLDGKGKHSVATGLGFFDHMLTALARHSRCDLTIKVDGDLHVDEHHTIEDTALALGETIKSALGDKRGVERYSFLLPMDEALSHIALDLGGRPWLIWECDFAREKVGDFPTEMTHHFFKSLCDTLGANLHVKVEGDNDHHKIEAIFKGFGRVLGQAVSRTVGEGIPSTKGVL